MKYLTFSILLTLCGISISCKSPNQVDQKEANDPPSVTISTNNVNITLGDTLRLTLHVADVTLLNGTVNYGDSSTVTFDNLHLVLDTTLMHIYKSAGSYTIALSFSDGEKSTSKEFSVTVLSEPLFKLTLAVNKTTLYKNYDTLKVTLHASDSTLSYGSLDFKDGTVISFAHLHYVFDTTISHIYQALGTYRISASFTNGYGTKSKEIDITFETNAPPGVSWEFNTTNLECGDTLWIHVFALDATLFNGSLDFNDGTILSFSRSNFFYASKYYNYINSYFFDTTLTHIYSQPGTYHITAIFSDGMVSTNKVNNVIVTTPPLVTLTVNKTNLYLGDTLKVTLHSSNITVSKGTLDFKDGTIVSFQNITHPFDTTITHVYSQVGAYLVAAIFGDGVVSTTVQSNITVQRYYSLSLVVGTTWLFRHHYDYSAVIGDGTHSVKWGTYEWRILSYSVKDSTFTVEQAKIDTNHNTNRYGLDTTYIVTSSSQFTIVAYYSFIQFNLPLIGGTFTLPNHCVIASYPIKVFGNNYPGGYVLFEDIAGPTGYHYDFSQKYSNELEELSLMRFTKP